MEGVTEGGRRRSSVCEPTFRGDNGVVLEEVELNPRSWGCMLPLAAGFFNMYYDWLIRHRLATSDASSKRVDARRTSDEGIKDVIKYDSVNAVCVRKVSANLKDAIEQQSNITEVAIAECNDFSSLPKVHTLRLIGYTNHDVGAIKINGNLTNVTKHLHVTLFVNANNDVELFELENYYDINVDKLSLSVYVKDVCRLMSIQKYVEVLRLSLTNLLLTITRGLDTATTNSLHVSFIFPKCFELEHTDCNQLLPLMQEFGGVMEDEHLTYTRFNIPFPGHETTVHVKAVFKAAYSVGQSGCFDDFLFNSYLD